MAHSEKEELLALNQRLLESIVGGDWKTYEQLCDPTLTCLEPEAHGQVVEGLAFHRFFFELGGKPGHNCTTMASPHVRILGDTAVLSYVRLVQKVNAAGAPVISGSEETRIWHRRDGQWRHVHFHRSLLPAS